MSRPVYMAPMTDTAEIRSDLRGPYFQRETVEIHLLDLYPSTPTRVERPNRLARIARSAFAQDVRARLPLILEVLGAFGVVCFGIVLLRGLAVAATIAGLR